MHPHPTGTVTFLFTDIQGSTQLWEQNPNAMRPALARHDTLLRQAIETRGGYVFKTVGDAFCAAFPVAALALDAAVAAQLALAAESWETETPILVRMALHMGSAEERDGDYFGPPLNRVARLMSAGHGGQTLLSLIVQERLADTLPPAVTLLDLGERRLKDLSRPERIFQILHASLPAEFPPLASLDNPALANNLPQQVTSFIGRETQAAEVKALLGKSRLLTLTGAGGSGKTRLSLQAAADLLAGDGDGVWLVELAPLSDPALVPQAVADVLGVKEQAGQTLQQSLTDALKSKRLLLVLDNCEHLVAACASLASDLLRHCPSVHILASSREPLNVPGEQIYRVPSLSLPDPKRVQTALSVSGSTAVALFADRARSVQPSFAVTDGNASAVAEVCSHLDGIPLAIELASARVRSLSVDQINTRLDQRFRLLTGGSRVALPRQQTLKALIDWSYDLLTDQEKTLLCRLSVFAGGWTLSAAEGICSGSGIEDWKGIEDWEVLDLLTGLVDKSLVLYEDAESRRDAGGTEGRYRLLETIRQYAQDRLRESGEAKAAQHRSALWFLALAEEAAPQLTGPEQAAWLGRLETEHDNLRASLSWYEQAQDTAQSLRLVGGLSRFWAVRGHYHEGRERCDRALKMLPAEAQELGSAEEAGLLIARAKASFGAGYLAYNQGEYGVARARYQQSLALFRHAGDQSGVTSMLDNLGNVAYELGDYAEARRLYTESLALARQLDYQRGIGSSLGNLGNVAHELGDYSAARKLHGECLSIQRQLGDQRGVANSLNNLGNMAHELSDYRSARDLHEASLTIQRQLGNQRGIANSLNSLGTLAGVRGDLGLAWELHRDALTIRRRLGDKGGVATSLKGMAQLASRQKQAWKTVKLLGAVSALHESIGIAPATAPQESIDSTAALMQEALGAAAFAAAYKAGRAMTLDEAVKYALEECVLKEYALEGNME